MNKYINSDSNPLTVQSFPWVFASKTPPYERVFVEPGKWMLFIPKYLLNKHWQRLRELYLDDKLPGVISMKCSTGYNSPKNEVYDNGVIFIHCNNSSDEEHIMNIGKEICSYIDFKTFINKPNQYIYYKTDDNTDSKNKINGNKQKYSYKLQIETQDREEIMTEDPYSD